MGRTLKSGHALEYRPDIDGLRAVAVLAVIVFHASRRTLPGGFVGVDVFFVISGFLISGLLFHEADRGGISLLNFYIRRIRRIVPALTIVLLAVTVFGWLALTNLDYEKLLQNVAAGSVFVSNFLLWRESGYFDAPTRFQPLLHLWSLGIEEQFYLFWPPIVLLCARRRWPVGRIAAGIVALSFLVNSAVVRVSPTTAFYMPFTRMWELLLGALLALPRGSVTDRILRGPRAEVVAGIGVLMIATAAGTITDGAAFAGLQALLPTIGTAALIAAGPATLVNRFLLANRPMVAIGLISYPLYLWHWPLLSFLQIVEGGVASPQQKVAAIALSFVLAAGTYWAIERPVRRSLGIATPLRVAAVAASLLLVGAVTFYASATDVLAARTPRLMVGFYSRVEPGSDQVCRSHFPTLGEYCHEYTTGLPVTTALIGDSHAAHFLEGVGVYLSRKGENVVHLGHSGCPPLLDLQRISDIRLTEASTGALDTCREADNSVIERVMSDAAIRRVIISFNGAQPLGGGGDQTVLLAGTLLPPNESVRIALQRTAERFLQANKSVWLILQVPELGFHPAECIRRPFSLRGEIRRPCAVPLADAAAAQAVYRQVIQDVKKDVPRLNVFDPWPLLCDREWCYAMINHELLYADNHHLSREGSVFFADQFTF